MNGMIRKLFLLAFLVPVLTVSAQEKDSLSVYLEQNPNAVDYNIISEGSKVYFSADDKHLLIHLAIANPTLQMRFLMQKATLYIDPSGKKKKRYKVVLPSAADVKDQMSLISNSSQKRNGDEIDNRPDIRPLVRALNFWGVTCDFDHDTQRIGSQYFHIDHNPQDNLLRYYILLPKEKLMQDSKLSDQWSLGISLVNDAQRTPPQPGMGGGREGMMPPPPRGDQQQGQPGGGRDQGDMQKVMQSNINSWMKFSIDDVNNANLK